MAKTKGAGERKGKGTRNGRPPLSPSGATKASTYRISPSGDEAIRGLSERLRLGSMAAAIELAVNQLTTALDRADAHPPLTPSQLSQATAALRAARVIPRTLGVSADFKVILAAAVMGAEGMAGEHSELLEAVRKLSGPESLWVLTKATGE